MASETGPLGWRINSETLFCKQSFTVNDMARPQISKTPLGQRLTDVRKALGFEARLPFAQLLGMNSETLGGYERGDSEPDAAFMAMYRQRFGVNISWLVTGDGSMFDDPSKAPPQTIDPLLLETLAKLASAVYRDAGIKLPGERATVEAADLYNQLVARVANIGDADEVEATLPQLRHLLKKRLSEAAAEPGAGKRSA